MHWFPFLAPFFAAIVLAVSSAFAQDDSSRPAIPKSTGADVKETTGDSESNGGVRETIRRIASGKKPGEHPLMPTLRLGRLALKRLEKIQDYSCTLVRRERIRGRLRSYSYQQIKIRHSPFSVYSYFLSPDRGREVIFVEGKNKGRLWVHEVGAVARLVGTVSLDPEGPRARRESHHPASKAGLMNLTKRIIGMVERDSPFGECDVKLYQDAKINGRGCLCVQITHPTRRQEFRFHLARIFFDDEWGIPIRFVAYKWPKKAGDKPPLYEEYNFLELKFNNRFTDLDFDILNPNYRFPRRSSR